MPRRLCPRGLAPALVAIAAIWRAQQLVNAWMDAREYLLASPPRTPDTKE